MCIRDSRVVQSYGGALDMSFDQPWDAGRYQRIDPDQLPPDLFVLINPSPGASSGVVHNDVRSRYEQGERAVVDAMATFAGLATEGAQSLAAGDLGRWPDLVDRAYDTRAAIWHLTESDRSMVALARSHGAAAAFAGSGGAMVCVPRPHTDLAELRNASQLGGFQLHSVVPGSAVH